MATAGIGETDNLTELENLNEQSLLGELNMRYKRNVIYTYVGEILVAMNPFKKIPGIYDHVKMVEYDSIGDRSSRPPHIFAGLKGDDKAKYEVGDAGEHRFLSGNSSALAKISSQLFQDMHKELVECMEIVGFSPDEIQNIFHLIAGILHIGDVEFGGEEASTIVSGDDLIEKICNQLGAELVAMKEALTTSVSIVRNDTVVKQYKPAESDDVRDASAKALYGRVFSYIVRKCNDMLGPKQKKLQAGEKTIGILDIFGFECFKSNSLEQLLINLANEQLQYFFNNHIFKMELDEYAREGIDGSKISFEDNQPLLDMMLSRPIGLLAICDEEALFPKGTDTSMVEKLHQNLTQHGKYYERPKGNANQFTVNHYAGKVPYNAEGFLEKNRDTLAMDVISVFRLSENALVRQLFGADDEDAKNAKKTAKTRAKSNAADVKKKMRQSVKKVAKEQEKTKRTTVGAAFKVSLEELMMEMSEAAPHFVRCIKPNMQKIPDTFDGELVTKQLRYTGMLETTRIRKEGYAYRPTFADFVERYKLLGYGLSSNPPPTDQTCRKIMEKSSLAGAQIGKTKVFLRYFHQDQLNEALRPYPTSAIMMQKVARGMVARRKFARAKEQAAKERAMMESLITKVDKTSADMMSVLQSFIEADTARPHDYFKKADIEDTKDAHMKKFAKSIKKQIKKEGGISRAASVRWFKEVEMKKGAGMKGKGNFEEWFHGIITRKEAEQLLSTTPAGTFLVRVAESRFGYSLSHCVEEGGRIKHYMIDQTPDGQYLVVGNRKLFPSLNELVAYHYEHKIVASDPVALVASCGQKGEHNDTAEFLEEQKKKK